MDWPHILLQVFHKKHKEERQRDILRKKPVEMEEEHGVMYLQLKACQSLRQTQRFVSSYYELGGWNRTDSQSFQREPILLKA